MECQHCGEKISKSNFARHQSRFHPELIEKKKGKKAYCPICSKEMCLQNIRQHMLNFHHADKEIDIKELKKQERTTRKSISKSFFEEAVVPPLSIHTTLIFIATEKLLNDGKWHYISELFQPVNETFKKFYQKLVFVSGVQIEQHISNLNCYSYLKTQEFDHPFCVMLKKWRRSGELLAEISKNVLLY